jgi:hypothetical protein
LIVANPPINAPTITTIRESNEFPRKLGTVDITWPAKTPPLDAMKRTVAILKESKDLFALILGLDEFGTPEVPDNFIRMVQLQNYEVSGF